MTEQSRQIFLAQSPMADNEDAHDYLIVSDLHVSDIEDNPDGWKAYKHPRFVFDAEFRRLLAFFKHRSDTDNTPLTLVLNGDIFDFDLITAIPDDPPWPIRRRERRRGLDATGPKSAWKLRHMLKDHPVFVRSLASFLSEGHSIVYTMGNHDREFYFTEVQTAMREALHTDARAHGADFADTALRFEPWFYYVPGRLYVEHGQQYDYYTSFQYLLHPVVRQKGENVLALPMGDLSNRYLVTRMGYFNPHASDYILNVFRYFTHWLKHYAFSRRSLVFSWFFGSIDVMGRLLGIKKLLRKRPPEYDALLNDVADRFQLPREKVQYLHTMHRLPITTRFFRIIREFWLDRLFLSLLMTGGTIALALVPIPLWIKLMVPLTAFPLLFFIYEYALQGETIFTAGSEIPRYAQKIATALDVRLVALGHIHQPRLIPLGKDVTFVDTGTWAPILQHDSTTELAQGYRNYVIAGFRKGETRIEYNSWIPLSSTAPENENAS